MTTACSTWVTAIVLVDGAGHDAGVARAVEALVAATDAYASR